MADDFIWTELNTTDPAAAARFYGAVAGWTTEAHDAGDDYRVFMAAGHAAGGLMRLPEAARDGGPYWAGYIHASDVDAETDAVRAAGGSVHVAPQDIPTVGRFAVVADPQGAVFMLMTPLPRDDAPPPAEPGAFGHMVWRELQTTDWPAAWAFYSERFGWEKDRAVDMGEMGTYQTFSIEGRQAGGMMNIPRPRPQWVHYIHVADIDVARKAIEAGGGSVLHGPDEIPGGMFSMQVRDPQGAIFGTVGPRKG